MKKLKHLLVMGALLFAGFAASASTIIVNSNILANKTWYRTNTYVLQGFIYVKGGATLTIQSGTIIKGDKGTKGALIVERGSKLIANGTVTQPIVFTSNQPVGTKNRGDWGGVILLGKAPTNQPGNAALGLAPGEGIIEGGFVAPDGVYGGTDPHDNSGSLKYVRIEYAGIAFQPNNEINGLTMGAVGDGTTIEHIQVSYSGDDSFEWFGGTVNCKWLIAFRGIDDDFDTDNGYSGKLQFLVGLRDPDVADNTVAGGASHGFESDNDPTASAGTPKTKALFSNVTIIGGNPTNAALPLVAGARIRRNTEESIYNSILMGFPAGLYIDGATTEANATANLLQFQNNIVACPQPLKVVTGSTFDIATYVTNQSGNTLFASAANASNNDVLLNDPFNLAAPNFLPQGGSPALLGAAFTNDRLVDAFFTPVSYRGAFGSSNWTSCWAEWDPQNQTYLVNPIDLAPVASIATGNPLTHCAGINVNFNANTGSGLVYQWYKGNAAQSGATSSTYANSAAGDFKVLVTNLRGCTKYSNTLTAVVDAPSVAISNGNNLSLCVNNPVALSSSSVTATSYQWTQDGADIIGATLSTYNATATATYAVRVVNGNGCTAVSSNKVVNSTTPKPTVTVNGFAGICPPQTTQLAATTVSGLSYQWQVYNGSAYSNISGATGANYTVTSPGKFRVRAISSFGCATMNSAAKTISNSCRFADQISGTKENVLTVYPNPFSKEATLTFNVENDSKVSINIFDMTGKLVMEVANGEFHEGENQLILVADKLISGLYVARISINGSVQETVKLSIQKN